MIKNFVKESTDYKYFDNQLMGRKSFTKSDIIILFKSRQDFQTMSTNLHFYIKSGNLFSKIILFFVISLSCVQIKLAIFSQNLVPKEVSPFL